MIDSALEPRNAIEPRTVIEVRNVTKASSADFDTARRRAFRDLWWRRSPTVRVGEGALIDRATFDIRQGETVGVLGRAGAGKVLLCRLLAGATQPSSGTIHRSAPVRLVPAGPFGTTPHMKLIEYARFLLAVYEVSSDDSHAAALAALEACGSSDRSHAKLHNIARVEINRVTQHIVLGAEADVFVFDRVPKIKDPLFQEEHQRRFETILESKAVVIAAQDPRRLPAVDRVLVLDGGRVEFFGAPERAFELFDQLQTRDDRDVHAPAAVDRVDETLDDFGDDEGDIEWSESSVEPDAERVSSVFAAARDCFGRAVAGDATVIVGPYLTHSGFEGTYWVPLLRGLSQRSGLAPEHLVAVTRGGGAIWYEGVARAVELDDLFDPEDLADRLEQFQRSFGLKQSRVSPFEQEVVERVRERFGLADALWLPPSQLSVGLRSERGESWSIDTVRSHLSYPELSGASGGTEPYVVAWFDHLSWFPNRPLYSLFVRRVLELLAERVPVRLVATDVVQIDGVRELSLDASDLSVTLVAREASRGDRLTHIARELRGAAAHVGTLGGASALALALGVPSVQLVSRLDERRGFVEERALIEAYALAVGGRLSIADVAEQTSEEVADRVCGELSATES